MPRIKGTLKLSSNIELESGSPLDARQVVPTKADLTVAANFPYAYIGLMCAVQEEAKIYVLKALPTTDAENWVGAAGIDALDNYYTKPEVDALISSVYKPAGASDFASLPDIDGVDGEGEPIGPTVLGNVYNMSEAFETTADFVEGAGKTYPIGSNVVVVDVGTELVPDYKFDVLPGFVDLTPYQEKIQLEILPTASEDELGNIYEYIGTTTGSFTNGYFYQCVEVADTDPVEYEWVEKPLWDVSAAGALSEAMTASIDVGGITEGTTFPANTGFEAMWRSLIAPTLYPEFTAPSATITSSIPALLEAGSSVEATLTVNFNRGAITPAYGTNGYRAGAATGYAINSGSSQVENTFDVTVDSANKSFVATVNYEAGEQPKDSDGADYNTPLAAGSVNSSAFDFELVDALWANTSSITTIAKLNLVSKTAGVYTFAFPAATVANPEAFDVPASWNITALEVLNTLSNTWDDDMSEFTITDVAHDNAAGTSVNYKRYTCNLPYAMGERKIRIKWN